MFRSTPKPLAHSLARGRSSCTQLSGADAQINPGGLRGHRGGHEHGRDKHREENQDHGEHCGQRRSPAHLVRHPDLHWTEQDADDRRPENRLPESGQQGEERGAGGNEQTDEKRMAGCGAWHFGNRRVAA
jgi:hypothetical protein